MLDSVSGSRYYIPTETNNRRDNMNNVIGTQFEAKGKTYQVVSVKPVDPTMTNTISKLEKSGKAPFYFGAGVVLKSGEVSEKQTGLFLRFNSGQFISYL